MKGGKKAVSQWIFVHFIMHHSDWGWTYLENFQYSWNIYHKVSFSSAINCKRIFLAIFSPRLWELIVLERRLFQRWSKIAQHDGAFYDRAFYDRVFIIDDRKRVSLSNGSSMLHEFSVSCVTVWYFRRIMGTRLEIFCGRQKPKNRLSRPLEFFSPWEKFFRSDFLSLTFSPPASKAPNRSVRVTPIRRFWRSQISIRLQKIFI